VCGVCRVCRGRQGHQESAGLQAQQVLPAPLE
jgi:hypothetical protein